MKTKAETILAKYIPAVAIAPVISMQQRHGFELKITRDRITKQGDYRPPHAGRGHRISVNRGLNTYSFLITLIHEIAHLITWEQYKRKARPHGVEWKQNFADLLKYFIRLGAFPGELAMQLEGYLRQPLASTCTDPHLTKLLSTYDEEPPVFLEELDEGAVFATPNGRQYRKENKRRKRFICEEIATGRKYLFNPVAQVILMD